MSAHSSEPSPKPLGAGRNRGGVTPLFVTSFVVTRWCGGEQILIPVHYTTALFPNEPSSGVLKSSSHIYPHMRNISSGCSDDNQHRYGTWPIDEPQVVNYQLTKTLPDRKLERKTWRVGLGIVHGMASLRLKKFIKCYSLLKVLTQ